MIAFGIVWILFKEILGETGKGWLPMPSWYIWGGGSLWLAGGLQCLEPSPTPSSELFRPLCFADYFFLSQLFGLRISKSQYSVCCRQALLSGSPAAQIPGPGKDGPV